MTTTAADLYRALAADGLTPAQIARQTGAKLQSVSACCAEGEDAWDCDADEGPQ